MGKSRTPKMLALEPEFTESHVKLVLRGSDEKKALYHQLVGKLDPDWPWAHSVDRRGGASSGPVLCAHCDGFVYLYHALSPAALIAIGKQVSKHKGLPGNLKVKVVMFSLRCKGIGKLAVMPMVAGLLAGPAAPQTAADNDPGVTGGDDPDDDVEAMACV